MTALAHEFEFDPQFDQLRTPLRAVDAEAEPALPSQPALFAVPQPAPERPVRRIEPALRLTRRGRLAVFGASVVTTAVMGIAIGAAAVASGESSELATQPVQVMAGDTLWDIAATANPGGDIRATMNDIIVLNALPSGGSLPVGAHLDVPVYE